ncbi:MAG: hypothetical protein ABW189_03780 [Rickettsiales bacterium]
MRIAGNANRYGRTDMDATVIAAYIGGGFLIADPIPGAQAKLYAPEHRRRRHVNHIGEANQPLEWLSVRSEFQPRRK